jgi:recombinational DNA repair protein RecT
MVNNKLSMHDGVVPGLALAVDKIAVQFTPEQAEWLRSTATLRNCSPETIVRGCVDAARITLPQGE